MTALSLVHEAVSLMKMKLLALSIIVVLYIACNPISLVGSWKLSQKYSYFYEKWELVTYDSYIEFEKDGTFKVSKSGETKSGTSMIDNTTDPTRLVLTDKDGEVVNGIFQLDKNSLTIKSTRSGNNDSQFLGGMAPIENENGVDLIILERN